MKKFLIKATVTPEGDGIFIKDVRGLDYDLAYTDKNARRWNKRIYAEKALAKLSKEHTIGFKEALVIAIDVQPADYCPIGRSSCRCGWSGEYPVSGCPRCHTSFTS